MNRRIFIFGLAALAAVSAVATDLLCIYYPEWHVYPEGEQIFGKGHSEWDLVRESQPRFPGHIQPVKLLDGEPDDSDPQDVAREIDYAADAGIDVWVYDWYWADGHPIQHEALEKGYLKAPNRNRLGFAIMWANHDRSDVFRTGIGKNSDRYWWKLEWTGEEFIAALDYCIEKYFREPGYYQRDGKPFFSVYSAKKLIGKVGGPGKMKAVLETCEEHARAAGLRGIHFSAMVRSSGDARSAAEAGYASSSAYNVTPYDFDDNEVGREIRSSGRQILSHEEFAIAHRDFNTRMADAGPLAFIPVVTRGWDCSPRCRLDEAFPFRRQIYPYYGIVTGLRPEIFRTLLENARRQAEQDPKRPGAVLVNAWNEFTEGCYLMPDEHYGDAFLSAVKAVFGR